jgi:hypothetical protein
MLRNEWMSKRNDLLKFLVENKIPLRQAIEMLEQAEPIIRRKVKEKAVLENYEKREVTYV